MRNLKQRQQGAVLIVSLILLLIITMVALSSLTTTTLEEKMASNLQISNQVFQATEAALEEGVDNIDFLSTVRISGTPSTAIAVTNDDARITSTYNAEFISASMPTGDDASSIDIGATGSTVSFYNFNVTAAASIPNTGAAATHVQGIYLKALAEDSTRVHKVP